jgi:ATP-dependent HslUV protease ATP-binding subunit HslU
MSTGSDKAKNIILKRLQLPGTNGSKASMFTPREIVSELDRFVVGQRAAKKAVAIALRNRWRRQQVAPPMKDEIVPKNIIMIGPTGVGKTEIARRLSRLAQAPFVKVEASKFTEVGYVGRDVDSIVRDLMEVSVRLVKEEEKNRIMTKAAEIAEEKLLDLLMAKKKRKPASFESDIGLGQGEGQSEAQEREKMRKTFRENGLKDRMVEINVPDRSMPLVEIFAAQGGMEDMEIKFQDMLQNIPGLGPKKKKVRKVTVAEAYDLMIGEEAEKLIDMDKVVREARMRAEQNGIVFIDELDKVAGRGSPAHGPDVSREGVQRDLLPIVEGTTVNTKHGVIKTDHILFIAAGAFHVARPSDLIPELQGRFPIRVELDALTKDDFVRILTEPENALTKQYMDLLATENFKVTFTDGAVEKIAECAEEVNRKRENIGARRLHTILETLLDDISFTAPERSGDEAVIDEGFVESRLKPLLEKEEDLYIL